MSSLIKNEITKILKKKSLYIMLIIIFAFIIISNVLYKYAYSSVIGGSYYSESYINILEEEIKKLNPENSADVQDYISYKTDIDTYNLLKKYDKNSWQYEVILNTGAGYISELNYATYQEKNEQKIQELTNQYNSFVETLNSGDWRKFAEEELNLAKQRKELAGENTDPMLDLQIEALQMRLDYNIEYGNNYKNQALSKYSESKIKVLEYEGKNNISYDEKLSYQEAKEDFEKSKYVLENDKDIFNQTNARGVLLNTFSEYELFIIITVVLIAGAIVSEEFNKGTIKLLLVRPYSRAKILFAKYVVVLLTVIFIMVAILIMQFIIAGIFFGYDSLSIPAVEYNHNANSIVETNVILSTILTGFAKMPIYILIGTLAFALSTLFTNTAVAITISLLGYMASSMVNQFAYYYNLEWLKYFVTPNWDFTQFLNGKLPLMEGLNIPFSIIICLIYFAIMMIPTFIVFKKKNIKNI